MSDSLGDEIISNPSAKTPVWKLFRFPGDGPECLHKVQPLDKTTTRYKQFVSAMVQFISQDMQPITVVDGSGFCNLMAVAEPRFVVPSRTYFMQTEIRRLYVDIKQEVQSVVSSALFHCITTDMWTSQHQVKGYLTLTTHFISSEWALQSLC